MQSQVCTSLCIVLKYETNQMFIYSVAFKILQKCMGTTSDRLYQNSFILLLKLKYLKLRSLMGLWEFSFRLQSNKKLHLL